MCGREFVDSEKDKAALANGIERVQKRGPDSPQRIHELHAAEVERLNVLLANGVVELAK